MSELNNDIVFLAVMFAVGFTIISGLAFAYIAFGSLAKKPANN